MQPYAADARGKMSFNSVRAARSVIDGGYTIDNTHAMYQVKAKIRVIRAGLTHVGLHGSFGIDEEDWKDYE